MYDLTKKGFLWRHRRVCGKIREAGEKGAGLDFPRERQDNTGFGETRETVYDVTGLKALQ